jgi:hypothetical protein
LRAKEKKKNYVSLRLKSNLSMQLLLELCITIKDNHVNIDKVIILAGLLLSGNHNNMKCEFSVTRNC